MNCPAVFFRWSHLGSAAIKAGVTRPARLSTRSAYSSRRQRRASADANGAAVTTQRAAAGRPGRASERESAGVSAQRRVGPDGVATGRQLWRRGSGRTRSHEALLWSSRSAVRLSSPDGAPRSRSPRRPFRTRSDQSQWLPVVQSRPRPAGNGVAGAMHLRSRDRGCIARRSRSTKEPRALLRCAALAELTHPLDLDLAKRSGGCRF
jgi:hypothetical protein